MPKAVDTLNVALDCLKAHPNWYLFPIRALYKDPPSFTGNLVLASNDPAQIRRWRAQNFGCNWGVALKKSKLIAVDVDRKPGKVGGESLDALELEHGVLPNTLVVQSPSGGLHMYFDEANGVTHQMRLNAFGKDIDSTNYTLIPGCTLIEDAAASQFAGTYDIVNDAPVAPSPGWFKEYLGEKSTNAPADNQDPAIEQDTRDIVTRAVEYLKKDAKPSIQGQNGEFTTLMVFAVLKDMGLSLETAIEVVNENYNVPGKCEPQWAMGEGPVADRLDVKAANAWGYLKDTQPGARSAQVELGEAIDQVAIDTIETAQALSQTAKDSRETWKDIGWESWAEGERERKSKATAAANKAADEQDLDAAEAQSFPPMIGDWEPEAEDGSEEIDAEVPAPSADDATPVNALALDPLADLDETEKPPQGALGFSILCQRWVWVTGVERFVNRLDPSVKWSRKQFDSEFNYLVKGSSVSNVLFKRKDLLRRFRNLCFVPGASEIPGTEYNIWRPSDIIPVPGDTSVWNEHIDYLFKTNTDEARDAVLNWMAFVLQNPDKKPNHALLIVGKNTGTGKSIVARIFEQLIGVRNTQRPKSSSMGGDFNSWLLNCRLCILEEVYQPGRIERLVSMRDLITEARVEVNIKGIPAFPIDNYVAIMGISNHPDALPLDKFDRRWYVIETFATRREFEYYRPLFKLLDDPIGLGAIYAELMARDLKDYSGLTSAPETDAREQMIDLSRSDVETWLIENSGNMPLARNVIQISDVISAMPAVLQRMKGLNTTIIPTFLKDTLNGKRHPEQVWLNNKEKARLWVLHGRYEMLKNENLAALYEAGIKEDRREADTSAKADFEE